MYFLGNKNNSSSSRRLQSASASSHSSSDDIELDDTSANHLMRHEQPSKPHVESDHSSASSGPEVYDEPPDRRSRLPRRRRRGERWWWPCSFNANEKCLLLMVLILSVLMFFAFFRVTLGPVGELVWVQLIARPEGYFIGDSDGIKGIINPTIYVGTNDMVHVKLINEDSASVHELYIEHYPSDIPPMRAADAEHPDKLLFRAHSEGMYVYSDSYTDGDMTVLGYFPRKEMGMYGYIYVSDSTKRTAQPSPPPSKVVYLNQSQLHTAHQDKFDISRAPEDVPAPLTRTTNEEVQVHLTCQEKIGRVANGVSHVYWTIDGKVPAPLIRVLEGDTVVVTLENPETNGLPHFIRFQGTQGGFLLRGESPVIHPGKSLQFQFLASHAGVYVYGEPNEVAQSKGMFGLLLVEPKQGLSVVDKEVYVMQHELYGNTAPLYPGHLLTHRVHLNAGTPSHVCFNGAYHALTNAKEIVCEAGQTIRFFVGVAGPHKNAVLQLRGARFLHIWRTNSGTNSNVYEDANDVVHVRKGEGVVLEALFPVAGEYELISVGYPQQGALASVTVTGTTDATFFQYGGMPTVITPWKPV